MYLRTVLGFRDTSVDLTEIRLAIVYEARQVDGRRQRTQEWRGGYQKFTETSFWPADVYLDEVITAIWCALCFQLSR